MNAYIDETGNCDIETSHDGASKYFIISAVIVNEVQNEKLKNDLDRIASKYFSSAEIKSSSVGSNDKRRLEILNDICELDFTYYSLIVNKELLFSKGFTYKKSFYKFLNGKLHSELYGSIPDLLVFHDSYGNDEYRESFREYIKKRHSRDLFSESDFYFLKGKECRQIQLADFICGCLARIYEPSKVNEFEKNYRVILSKLRGAIEEWPVNEELYDLSILSSKSDDEKIEKIALHSVYEYLGRNEGLSDDDNKSRAMFLRYLLYSYKYFSKKEFIYTQELRNHMAINNIRISNYHIRSQIVAPLRDYGVLIASSSHGYKIPVSKSDIIKYIQHSSSIIEPMVRRMNKLQKVLLLGSGGSIDIHKNYNFPNLIKE